VLKYNYFVLRYLNNIKWVEDESYPFLKLHLQQLLTHFTTQLLLQTVRVLKAVGKKATKCILSKKYFSYHSYYYIWAMSDSAGPAASLKSYIINLIRMREYLFLGIPLGFLFQKQHKERFSECFYERKTKGTLLWFERNGGRS